MKTTIELPEPIFRRAKIHAAATGQTLKQLVLISLSRELGVPSPTDESVESPWKTRKMLPDYEAARKAGAYQPPPGARDITAELSEDRDAR
jgi:hypothetical protein